MKFLITMGLGIGMAISAHATDQLITEEISDTQLAQITSQLEKSINNESFEKCDDTRIEPLFQKYAISYDADGKLCRFYDLSFVTLRNRFSRKSVSEIPVYQLKAKDYINWVEGRPTMVLDELETQKELSRRTDGRSRSWVRRLQFKNKAVSPNSFKLSDVETRRNIQFTNWQRLQLRRIFARIASANKSGQIEDQAMQYWQMVSENPQQLLENIRFDWNELRQVYEIALEGDFLPLNSPVAMIDFQRPHKPAVESIIRNLMFALLRNVANFIPEPTVKQVMTIALDDLQTTMNATYEYHLMLLENRIAHAHRTGQFANMDAAMADKIVQLAYAPKADIVTGFIQAAMQGRTMDWSKVEDLARRARYTAVKQREVMIGRAHSHLVLSKGCQTQIVDRYFAICHKEGQPYAMHSLLSMTQLWFWNLGAPAVYYFDRPRQVEMMRKGAWLLSVGVRMVTFPIPGIIRSELYRGLQTYWLAGLTDEAMLRDHFAVTRAEPDMRDQLYRQAALPFSSQSAEQEQRVIQQNMSALLQGAQ